MDLGQTASRWNRAISLENPTASAVASQLRARPQRVFADAPDFLYLGNNLVLKLPPATEYDEIVPALSISLVLRRSFFPANALIRTEDVPRLAFLGMNVPCSAQAMLEHLTGKDAKNVTTATEQDRWTIDYGRGLSMLFLPVKESPADASHAELAMIEFFYSLPFDGQLSPNVEEVSAALP
jgi:hypothetical protein